MDADKNNEMISENFSNEDMKRIKLAKKIISEFVSDGASFKDFLIRIMGFTNKLGSKAPSEDVDSEINIIPALEKLEKFGFVTFDQNSKRWLRKGDTLSKLASLEINKDASKITNTDNLLDKNKPSYANDGKLEFTQIKKLNPFSFNKKYLTDDEFEKAYGAMDDFEKCVKVVKDAMGLHYKKGGAYSGTLSDHVINCLNKHNSYWKNLSEAEKDTVKELDALPYPYTAFLILKTLNGLKDKKSIYSYSTFLRDTDDDKFRSSVNALTDMSFIIGFPYRVNKQKLKDIINVIRKIEQMPYDDDIKYEILKAILPKFLKEAKDGLNRKNLQINNLLKNEKFKIIKNYVFEKLTNEEFEMIKNTPESELNKNLHKIIKKMIVASNSRYLNQLKEYIKNKYEMFDSENYTNNDLMKAKQANRVKEFFNIFLV